MMTDATSIVGARSATQYLVSIEHGWRYRDLMMLPLFHVDSLFK
jgi:hypothetical protein